MSTTRGRVGRFRIWSPKSLGHALSGINIRGEPLRGELRWAVSQLQEVQEVIVADSNVGVDECIVLAGLDNLHTISLHGSTIERGSVAALCRSRSLQNLGLAFTNTTDGDCQHIASCRSITTLNLSGTLITDTGLSWIATLPRLSHLAISPDAITPTGLAGVVARHPTLVIQCFGPSKFEERQWKEIEQRFPRCEIHR